MIRKAIREDAKVILKIVEEELGYDATIELVEKQIDKFADNANHQILVYQSEEGHQVAGFIEFELYESVYVEGAFNVLNVAVASTFQGQGIGRALMQALEDYACSKNGKILRLNSGSHRHQAHHFYESLGYDGSKVQKRFIKYLT